MLRNYTAFFALLFAVAASAQTTRQEIVANPELAAGIYHSYEAVLTPAIAPPAGYKPVYISHYGRHGSRWHTSESAYESPLKILREAHEKKALTAAGEALLTEVERLAVDAKGRYGALSPRGEAEHRGIAERMFANYPTLFSTAHGRVCRIESRSTTVPRCILSMAAFNERLKELNPAIRTSREASERYATYLAHSEIDDTHYKRTTAVADSLYRVWVDPTRFVGTLFRDPAQIEDSHKFMRRIFALASIAQDVSYLNIDLFGYFTPEELWEMWRSENVTRYLTMGASVRFGDPVVAGAKPLLRNIIETADSVLAGKTDLTASLRFGHDVFAVPLYSLLGIEGAAERVANLDSLHLNWAVQRVTPMGTNLQMIFFRNDKTGDVRVRVLHNEHDARLPIEGAPFYPWNQLRSYLEAQCQKK